MSLRRSAALLFAAFVAVTIAAGFGHALASASALHNEMPEKVYRAYCNTQACGYRGNWHVEYQSASDDLTSHVRQFPTHDCAIQEKLAPTARTAAPEVQAFRALCVTPHCDFRGPWHDADPNHPERALRAAQDDVDAHMRAHPGHDCNVEQVP